MDNNSISFNPVSGADSTSIQEQIVKGSLSSSNLNECEELEEVDLDFHKYDYRSGHPAVFCCTYHKYNEGRPLAGMWLDLYTFSCYEDFVAACRWLHRDEQDPEFPMSGTVRAASMRTHSSAFSSTLTSMMTSRRPSGRFWMSPVTAMRISRISASVTAADGTARRSSPSTSPMSFACSTMFPRASPAFLTSRPSPVSCSCLTMTWAMAVTCSVPAEP